MAGFWDLVALAKGALEGQAQAGQVNYQRGQDAQQQEMMRKQFELEQQKFKSNQDYLKEMLANRPVKLSETGKYNIAQKYYFWTLTVTIAVMVVTGLVVWQPYFAPLFPLWLLRLAVLLHSLAAFVAVVALIVHVYAAYWVRGSIPAMTRGTVTRNWAKHHHPGWYREVSKGGK